MSSFQPAPVKPTVPFAALDAVDIRLGTITAVADVPGSRKLVRLTVNFGSHARVILAGLKQERADPTELIGRRPEPGLLLLRDHRDRTGRPEHDLLDSRSGNDDALCALQFANI